MQAGAINAVRSAQDKLTLAAERLRVALGIEYDGHIVDALSNARQALEATRVLLDREYTRIRRYELEDESEDDQ